MNQNMPNTYDEALDMNIQGVLLMRESKFGDAVACFQRGLETLLLSKLDRANISEGLTSLCENHYSPKQRPGIQLVEPEDR
jgi:hypothetical protein